jgi:hypothetical protein
LRAHLPIVNGSKDAEPSARDVGEKILIAPPRGNASAPSSTGTRAGQAGGCAFNCGRGDAG